MHEQGGVAGLRVGTRLKGIQDKLVSQGAEIARLVEPPNRQLLEEALRRSAQSTFKIAVVGQIKAGKSSFVNALIQQPGFVPTHVNPWTTAITRLVFNHQPDDGAEAVFHFFNEREWQHLVAPSGRLRSLSEKLVPGYNFELIRDNLDIIRQRAMARLGPDFVKLLGHEHRVARITTEILAQYVSASDGAVAAEDGAAGRYSDVTRSADVYLRSGPFDVVTLIIDTPGTNDPFLFRDEITHQALEEADTYIVVLTAQQPLSSSDLALLRILRSLQKERIIIFVNRVDELNNFARDLPDVQRYLANRLNVELPGLNVPIILGSAWWANLAQGDDDRLLDGLLQPGALDAMRMLGVALRSDQISGLDPERTVAVARAAMFAASGVPRVYQALDTSLAASPNTALMYNLCQSLVGFAQATLFERQHVAGAIGTDSPSAAKPAAADAEYIDRLCAQLLQLQEAAEITQSAVAELRRRNAELVEEDGDRLLDTLRQDVTAHAELSAGQVTAASADGVDADGWRFDPEPLRRRLAIQIESAFRRTSSRVSKFEGQILPRLSALLTELAPGQGQPQHARPAAKIEGPSLFSLNEAGALDLDATVWAAWWQIHPTAEERGEQLRALILSEFDPIIENLTRSFKTGLNKHVEETWRWSHAICNEIVRHLGTRLDRIRALYNELEAEGGERPMLANGHAPALPSQEVLEKLAAALVDLDRDFSQLIGSARLPSGP
jgi:signal recognition particle receptor subunit beta